jgi:LysM repeat protein
VRTNTPTVTATASATTVLASTATGAPVPSATPSPAAITYVVQPGDTLTYIARSFGTTVDALMAANGLTSTQITVGQVLKIP